MLCHGLLIRKWHRYATALFMSAAALTAQAIEEPAYTIEKAWEAEQIEIRSYGSRVMAVTTMQDDEDNGFRVLAGYIFGGNAEEEKIAMTAPVQQSMEGEQEMAFIMPAQYALEDLPEPRDQPANLTASAAALTRARDLLMLSWYSPSGEES